MHQGVGCGASHADEAKRNLQTNVALNTQLPFIEHRIMLTSSRGSASRTGGAVPRIVTAIRPSAPLRAPPLRVAAHYVAPSRAVSSSELESLGHYSVIVPDVPVDTRARRATPRATAASVSPSSLRSIVASEATGIKPFQAREMGPPTCHATLGTQPSRDL
jgi:hypothetical protein